MKQELNSEEKSGLAERIKYVRKEIAHQTQKEFAFSLYVSRAYINQLENCKISILPSAAFFQSICSKYGISEEWIRFGHEPILQTEIDEIIESYKYLDEHFNIPESILYFTEQLYDHYLSDLEFELLDILNPNDISEDQYAKIIDTFIVLSRPFFSSMKILKEDMMKNEKDIEEVYNRYIQKLKETIDVYFKR
ncbi:MAG: helix-turn-helix domain-containing protein [Blautia hansenii]